MKDTEIIVCLSGKQVQKNVSNYLKNSKETQQAIQGAVDKVMLEDAMYDKLEKQIVDGCIQRFITGYGMSKLKEELKQELLKDILSGAMSKLVETYVKTKLEI